MALSIRQVTAAGYLAGWRGEELAQAVAVAYAESGFNPNAQNSCCKGLWQINKNHTELMASGNWRNPVDNAHMAYSIYKSAGGFCTSGKPPTGCNPWQAYGNSRYQSKLNAARLTANQVSSEIAQGTPATKIVGSAGSAPAAPADPSAGGQAAATSLTDLVPFGGGLADAIAGITKYPAAITAWIGDRNNWLRIMKVAGGLALVLAGVAIVARPAVDALPTGKAAKMAAKLIK